MGRYASNTSVSASKSRDEIERTLSKYGATSFMYGWEGGAAVIGFRMMGKMVQFMLQMPDKESYEFKYTPSQKQRRSTESQEKAWEQATRQRWRAFALIVKAKLEAVESNITTFEEEFLAHILLPNGQTAGDYLLPQIQKAYDTGKMPPMLPMLAEHKVSND